MVEQWKRNDQKTELLMLKEWNIWRLNSGTSDGGTEERKKVKQENRNDQKVEDLMLE